MHSEGTFVTSDGLRLFRQEWQPPEPPRLVVVLVHGYADHSSRYAHIARHLNEAGAAVYTYDHRGHGRSEGRRAYIASFDEYVADLGAFLQSIRPPRNDLPLFLFGHSMGGLVCTYHALAHQGDLRGLILSSPALKVSERMVSLLQKMSQLIGRLFPGLPTIRLDRRLMSKDPAVVRQALQDPLNFNRRIPARAGAEILRATRQVHAQMRHLTLPLLIIHGTEDGLTIPQGSVDMYETAASEDKTLALFPGLYHETFNEPEKRRVLLEISAWLNEHI